MNCFEHRQSAAVAACRCCGKGLCPDCVQETGPTSIVCGAACAEEVKRQLDLQNLAARQVGLGARGGANPTYVMAYFAIGAVMTVLALYNILVRDEPIDRNYYLVAFGALMIAIGFVARNRSRPPRPS
jgi:hypothetical protein